MEMEDKVKKLAQKIASYKRGKTNTQPLKNFLRKNLGIKRLTQNLRKNLSKLFSQYGLEVIDIFTNEPIDWATVDTNTYVFITYKEKKSELSTDDKADKQVIKEKKNSKAKKLDSNDQKNILQNLLQDMGYKINTEKKFDWLKAPDKNNIPPEYIPIIKALENYRGKKDFFKSNFKLACDIVIEEEKIIIEYDERQHFSEPRRITLLNYPKNLTFYFPIDKWIEYCENIKAKDNNPHNRDEGRAFYDAVRDIEAAKHGYKLIRIKHGEFDWAQPNAQTELKKLLKDTKKYSIHNVLQTLSGAINKIDKSEIIDKSFQFIKEIVSSNTEAEQNKTAEQNSQKSDYSKSQKETYQNIPQFSQVSSNYDYEIARLVITDRNKIWDDEEETTIREKTINSFIQQVKNKKIKFLITPGGFLNFSINFINFSSLKFSEHSLFLFFSGAASLLLYSYLLSIKDDKLKLIQNSIEYLSIGIDFLDYENEEKSPHIELVLLYDLKNMQVINSTGKFYPISKQAKTLIKVTDFDTKFLTIDKEKVLILGCHDLNVFNPRGQANLGKDSYKAKISKDFHKRFLQEKPKIILHHPHETDTPNIWRNAWNKIEKDFPFVQHYASGIYYPKHDNPRGSLSEVLEKTKKGSVLDIIL